MARRGSSPSRGSSGFGRGRSPSPSARRPAPAPRAVAPAPAPTQVAQPAMAQAAPGGGFMANVASTAAGVAIGHTVGHAITGSLMGHGNQTEPAVAEQQQPVAPYNQQSQQANQDPCRFELDQFLSCAQSQSGDLSLCDGFNQVLRECKTRYGGERLYQ